MNAFVVAEVQPEPFERQELGEALDGGVEGVRQGEARARLADHPRATGSVPAPHPAPRNARPRAARGPSGPRRTPARRALRPTVRCRPGEGAAELRSGAARAAVLQLAGPDREPCVCQHRRRRTFTQRHLGDRGGASGQFICRPERPGELRSAVLGSPPERPGAGAGRVDGDSNRLSGCAVDVASGSERVPGEPEHAITHPGRSCATVGCVTSHRERQLCGCEPREQAVVLLERRADAHGLERPDDAILHESGDGERSGGARPGGGSKGRCGDASTDDAVCEESARVQPRRRAAAIAKGELTPLERDIARQKQAERRRDNQRYYHSGAPDQRVGDNQGLEEGAGYAPQEEDRQHS